MSSKRPSKTSQKIVKVPMNRPVRLFYEFGPFRLDATERVLLREGKPLLLTPKGVEILLTLVESRGRLLEKEELLDKVWADTFVEPANLTQTVSVLRKMLGDDAQTPQYIQTVPTRGYRFIAEVNEVSIEEEEISVEEHSRSTVVINQVENINRESRAWQALKRRLPQRKIALVTTVALFSLSGVGLGLLLFARSGQGGIVRPADIQFKQFFAVREQELSTLHSARFSPDGNLVAYAHTGDGQDLWVKQVGDSLPHRVTNDQWLDFCPVWSPDGQRLAYVSNRGNQIGIWTIPYLGGTAELVKILGDNSLDIKGGPPLLKAWSKDGRTIYYEWNHNFYSLDLNSQEKTVLQLTHLENASQFALSPDEKRIAYQGSDLKIWLADLLGGRPIQATNEQAVDLHPVWHPDGKHLIYNSLRDGRSQIFLTDLESRSPISLMASDFDGSLSDVSQQGKLLCFGRRNESHLFSVDIESGRETQLTDSLGVEFWPSATPDGSAIAFQSIVGERFDWDPRKGTLLKKHLGVSESPQMIAADAFDAEWSPDGKTIAFLRWTGRSHALWTVPAAGGAEKMIIGDGVTYGGQTGGMTYDRLQTADCSWSPDNQQIAFCVKENGISNIHVVSADGVRRNNISESSTPNWRFHCPLWSPDGEQVAYVLDSGKSQPLETQFWEVWVWKKSGKPERIYHTSSIIRLLGWQDNENLAVAMMANTDHNRIAPKEVQVVSVSLSQSIPRELVRLHDTRFYSLRLSGDKRNLFFVASHEGRENIFTATVAGGQAKQITRNDDGKRYYSSLAWPPERKEIYFARQTQWSVLVLVENIHFDNFK